MREPKSKSPAAVGCAERGEAGGRPLSPSADPPDGIADAAAALPPVRAAAVKAVRSASDSFAVRSARDTFSAAMGLPVGVASDGSALMKRCEMLRCSASSATASASATAASEAEAAAVLLPPPAAEKGRWTVESPSKPSAASPLRCRTVPPSDSGPASQSPAEADRDGAALPTVGDCCGGTAVAFAAVAVVEPCAISSMARPTLSMRRHTSFSGIAGRSK